MVNVYQENKKVVALGVEWGGHWEGTQMAFGVLGGDDKHVGHTIIKIPRLHFSFYRLLCTCYVHNFITIFKERAHP